MLTKNDLLVQNTLPNLTDVSCVYDVLRNGEFFHVNNGQIYKSTGCRKDNGDYYFT